MKLRYKISIWLALALAGSLLWGGSGGLLGGEKPVEAPPKTKRAPPLLLK